MPPFDPNQTIEEEAGLPEHWKAVEVAPINPGAPPAQSPNTRGTYYSAAIGPTMQHDATLVGTKYSGRTPQNALMPLPASALPTNNSAAKSVVIATPSTPATPAQTIGGVHLLTASYTATSGDYSKLLSFNVPITGSTPSVRNFGSSPAGDGDSTFTSLQCPTGGFTFTAITGDTIVVFAGKGGGGGVTVTGVTDNVPGSPNTYTNEGNGFWVSTNITGGSNFHVTIAYSGGTTFPAAYVWDIAGAVTFEQTVRATVASNTTPTVALTTTNQNDLIMAGVELTASGSPGATVSAGGSFILDTNYNQVSGEYVYTPSANNGVTPYGGAEHLGVSGIFSGSVTMPVTSGGASFTAWQLSAIAMRPANTPAVLTLPANPPSSVWYIAVENTGTQTLTVNPNGKKLDGSSSSLLVPTGQGLFIFTDGLNYYTERGLSSAGITLETNGTPNGSQVLLNLISGANISVTDNGSGGVTIAGTGLTIASGTATLGTSLIASGAAATTVTVSAPGVLATDNVMADFSVDPTGTTGYAPSASGMLMIVKFCTADHVNFVVINNTASSITPGAAITLNWKVIRQVAAAGTATLGTSAIPSGTAAATVTVPALAALSTDNIVADFNADPTATTGYAPSASGGLTIVKYCTAGNVNFIVINNTGSSITPGAVVLNWRIVRQVIASGSTALGTSAILSGASALITVAAIGVLATDNLLTDFNADPTGVTGYAPSISGMLTIVKFCTAGHVNFYVVNNTGSSITPGAITLNWRVIR